MPRTKPSYPPEFKAEAVRLVGSGDRSLTRIAKDLGVAYHTLRSWVQHVAGDDSGGDVLAPCEREELRQLRREVRTLRQEREIVTQPSSRQRARRDPLAVFAVVEKEKANEPVATLCRLLGVSRSGYDACRKRPPAARIRANQELTRHIKEVHEHSRGTSGAPRIWAELRDRDVVCSRKRVARLLRLTGLQGCHRRNSDKGSKYASLAFGRRLREAGLTGSMGSRGDCFDHAAAESFFATLECELLARHRFSTRSAARLALFDDIEGFSNTHRRHSALGYL